MLYGWYSEKQSKSHGSVEYRLINGEVAQITEVHALPNIHSNHYSDMRFIGEIEDFNSFVRRVHWGRSSKKTKLHLDARSTVE